MTHWVKWDHVMIVWSEYNAREVRINTGWCRVVAGSTDRVAQRGVSAFSVVQPQCWPVLCSALQCQGPADRSRSVSCCHDNSTVMTTHTHWAPLHHVWWHDDMWLYDNSQSCHCDFYTQLVCRSQQRNEFNINIVTVTPDSESRAVGLSPPSL